MRAETEGQARLLLSDHVLMALLHHREHVTIHTNVPHETVLRGCWNDPAYGGVWAHFSGPALPIPKAGEYSAMVEVEYAHNLLDDGHVQQDITLVWPTREEATT